MCLLSEAVEREPAAEVPAVSNCFVTWEEAVGQEVRCSSAFQVLQLVAGAAVERGALLRAIVSCSFRTRSAQLVLPSSSPCIHSFVEVGEEVQEAPPGHCSCTDHTRYLVLPRSQFERREVAVARGKLQEEKVSAFSWVLEVVWVR